MQKFWGAFAMILATVLWGVAFSAQSSGAQIVGPMLFVMLRSVVGVAALIVVIMAFDLVQLYAQRQRNQGYAYGKDTLWQQEFEENFP